MSARNVWISRRLSKKSICFSGLKRIKFCRYSTLYSIHTLKILPLNKRQIKYVRLVLNNKSNKMWSPSRRKRTRSPEQKKLTDRWCHCSCVAAAETDIPSSPPPLPVLRLEFWAVEYSLPHCRSSMWNSVYKKRIVSQTESVYFNN